MHVCLHAARLHACTHACRCAYAAVRLYACMHACVCMRAWLYVYIHGRFAHRHACVRACACMSAFEPAGMGARNAHACIREFTLPKHVCMGITCVQLCGIRRCQRGSILVITDLVNAVSDGPKLFRRQDPSEITRLQYRLRACVRE